MTVCWWRSELLKRTSENHDQKILQSESNSNRRRWVSDITKKYYLWRGESKFLYLVNDDEMRNKEMMIIALDQSFRGTQTTTWTCKTYVLPSPHCWSYFTQVPPLVRLPRCPFCCCYGLWGRRRSQVDPKKTISMVSRTNNTYEYEHYHFAYRSVSVWVRRSDFLRK